MTTSFTDDGPFPPSALGENAAGRLSDAQRKRFSGMSRGLRKGELSFAAIAVIIGALVAFASGPAKDATIKPIIGLVCLAIAAILVVRALGGGDKITQDVRAGRVESIDGAIAKHVIHTDSSGSSSELHYLDVGGRRFHTGASGYEIAPDAGYVRLFYLPRSQRVVNLQIIPGPATPDLTPASLQTVLENVATGSHGRGEVGRAEARAQMASMVTKFTSQVEGAPVPPRADQLDQRPLTEAIIGTWSSPLMTVSFAPDGTATQTIAMTGKQTSGRWSVDAQGQLHAGLGGQDESANAWISGDTLTISMGGMSLAFQRQAPSPPTNGQAQRFTCFAVRMLATAFSRRVSGSVPASTAATSAAAVVAVSEATCDAAAVYSTMSAPAVIDATTALGTE
jgi:hypothetical protein